MNYVCSRGMLTSRLFKVDEIVKVKRLHITVGSEDPILAAGLSGVTRCSLRQEGCGPGTMLKAD